MALKNRKKPDLHEAFVAWAQAREDGTVRIELGQKNEKKWLKELRLFVQNPQITEAVANDIRKGLAQVQEHTKRPHLHFSLSIMRTDGCTKWHVDRMLLRAIITWLGPGTLVADSDNVKREYLGRAELSPRETEEAAIIDMKAVHQVPTGEWYVLLGQGDATGETGTVHRSPAIAHEGGVRVVGRLDVC